MKSPISARPGDLPDEPQVLDSSSGIETRPPRHRDWQSPRLNHLEVESGTKTHIIGTIDDAGFLDS